MEFEHKVAALDDEDLAVGEKEEKNWKGIVISLLVIGSIMGAIVISIILCTPDGDSDSNKLKLDLDNVISDAYKSQSFEGAFISGHEIVYVDQNGHIVIFDAQTNRSTSLLVKKDDKTLHTMRDFQLSPDRQSILFATEIRYEFGARKQAKYAIYNISSQTVEFMDDFVKASHPLKQAQIQYATWAGSSPNSIVFIESNDIFYVPDYTHASQQVQVVGNSGNLASSSSSLNNGPSSKYFRLTKTGAISDSFTNGLPDSLYRNNILNSKTNQAALWWSADNRQLAYLTFDDAQVEQTPIEYYDNYMYDSNSNPKIHYERYPRAGSINPRVSVHIVDLSDPAGEEFDSSVILAPNELLKQQQMDARQGYYVTYVGWLHNQSLNQVGPANGNIKPMTSAGSNQLLIIWSNRAQNSSILSACDNIASPVTGGRSAWKCDVVTTFLHRIPPSFDANRNVLAGYNINGTRLIFLALPRPDSIIGDHYHVAMLRGEEKTAKYLTHGQYDIDRLVHYDSARDSLYFEAKTSENGERHLYIIWDISRPEFRQTRCLTCNLREPCSYNQVHISPTPDAQFLVHECLGPDVPVTRLRRIPNYQKLEREFLYKWLQKQKQGSFVNKKDTQNRSTQKHDDNVKLAESNDMLPSQMILNMDLQMDALIKSKQMPIEKYITIKANQQFPYDVNVKLYLPNESEEEKDKRFPLLIESSDISRRNVWKRFNLDFGKYLASRKQLVYAQLDCIKSGPQMPVQQHNYNVGEYLSSATSSPLSSQSSSLSSSSPINPSYRSSSSGSLYRSSYNSHQGYDSSIFGSIGNSDEVDELESPLMNARVQVEAIKFIAENPDLFPFIDRRRIAIWGPNSMSAYVALASTLYDETKLIQCTIAVSPITNWRYMNSYSAEHYFGLPWLDSNNLKYERSNLLKRSSEFSMRKLLIVHGTADEQVHIQHSMQFMKALTEHHPLGGVIHQMQLYPDVGHSLEPVRKHFYLTLDGFIDRCFYQKPITIKATEWKGKRVKIY